ncbi:hypothetical protein K440DRAFT_623255 [Wilcoxina mikolae CBS 423.85]|nr:hypothetical protein K440DRAFT_623255 [Wilcoxina mikolae CBS 423.85]
MPNGRTLPLSPGSFLILLLQLSLVFATTAFHYLNPQVDKYSIPAGAGMAAIVCIGLIADSLEGRSWAREKAFPFTQVLSLPAPI